MQLLAHPDCNPPHGVDVGVELTAQASGWVQCMFRIRAPSGMLAYPQPSAPLDPERLWEHTCCELFVAEQGQAAYEEWNFSPTGQHAHFEFEAYRERRHSKGRLPAKVQVEARLDQGSLELTTAVPVSFDDDSPIRLAPTVVLEDTRGVYSYWALRHPGPRPDFHHRDGFSLLLTQRPVPSITEIR